MPIPCPRRSCPGTILDGEVKCKKCQLDVTELDRAFAQGQKAAEAPPPPPGFWRWLVGGDGIRFGFQFMGLITLILAIVLIGSLFSQSSSASNDKVKLSEFTTRQGLIAGVLLTAVSVAVIVAIMTVLFSSSTEPLKDRIQLVRDILAPILAIFGTITGFYFGANPGDKKEIPKPVMNGKQEDIKEARPAKE